MLGFIQTTSVRVKKRGHVCVASICRPEKDTMLVWGDWRMWNMLVVVMECIRLT